jgi:3-methyladenine DNA glycosylase AlkD
MIQPLRIELKKIGDPLKAAGMQAYMKSPMPYHGVPTPLLRPLCRHFFNEHPFSSPSEWQEGCLTLWREAQFREERYAAIDLSGHRLYRSWQRMATLPMYEEMIVTGAWWDYVDTIATHRLAGLLKAYPARMRTKMMQWSRSRDLWKRRSAILCQLHHKQETDLEMLYACVEPSLESKEFFLQKAIGWALRQYAWTNPQEVRRYCATHELSNLSRREALKNIGLC